MNSASQPGQQENAEVSTTSGTDQRYEGDDSTRSHALSHACRVIQLLPEDLRVVPANLDWFLVDVEMPADVIAVGTMVRDQDLDLLRSNLLDISSVFPDCRRYG